MQQRQRSQSRNRNDNNEADKQTHMLLPPAPRESSKKVHYSMQVHPKLGKLSSPSLEEASCDGPKPQHRLFVTDASTGTQYLVDTGAEISVLPKHFLGTLCQPIEGNTLFAANNTSIQVYGSKLLIVDLKLRRTFKWVFTVADVRKPILGADFLSHYHLLPDLRTQKLIDAETHLFATGKVLPCIVPSITTVLRDSPFHEILRRFSDITRQPPPGTPSNATVRHHIFTKGPPVAETPRRHSPEKLKIAQAEFQFMVEQGWCRPSSSPWASPLHLVPKVKQCDSARQLPHSPYSRLCEQVTQQNSVLKNRPRARVQSDPSGRRRHSKNGSVHPVRSL
jgi:hypothetical protein